jgi:ABC-type uncharacterized transport system permease subunit
MERLPLVISTICFLLGFAYTMYALGAGRYRPSRSNLMVVVAGFLFQTWFLYERGHKIGRCPLTNLFEVLLFLSWSMGLLYLLIGPAYRLSLLGAFTSPLVFFFQFICLIAPIDLPARINSVPNPWLELHAALSVVAYGAFAMAGVAGAMYLAQEKHLKTHHIGMLFFQMPPISELATVTTRLLWAGFGLLTAGLLAGVAVGGQVNRLKLGWGIAMWGVYFAILVAHRVGPRRIALFSVVAFMLALTSLWGLNYVMW